MTTERFVLRSRDGEKLRADLRYVANGEKKPVILFLHGFKGFKDWGPFPWLLERIAEAGFVAISFNFSHNGVGDDLQAFTELDRFAQNRFTLELEEVEDVLREIASLEYLPIDHSEIEPTRIGVLGHSRGGAMAILAARWYKLIRAVVSASPVSTFDRYSERQKEKWRRERVFEVQNVRTKQVMRLDVGLLDDLEQHRDRLNILSAAAHLPQLDKPLLVISGSEDLTATPKEAKDIADAGAGPFTELQIVSNTGHTFGAEHPFKGSTPALQQVLRLTIDFFTRYLVEHPIPVIR